MSRIEVHLYVEGYTGDRQAYGPSLRTFEEGSAEDAGHRAAYRGLNRPKDARDHLSAGCGSDEGGQAWGAIHLISTPETSGRGFEQTLVLFARAAEWALLLECLPDLYEPLRSLPYPATYRQERPLAIEVVGAAAAAPLPPGGRPTSLLSGAPLVLSRVPTSLLAADAARLWPIVQQIVCGQAVAIQGVSQTPDRVHILAAIAALLPPACRPLLTCTTGSAANPSHPPLLSFGGAGGQEKILDFAWSRGGFVGAEPAALPLPDLYERAMRAPSAAAIADLRATYEHWPQTLPAPATSLYGALYNAVGSLPEHSQLAAAIRRQHGAPAQRALLARILAILGAESASADVLGTFAEIYFEIERGAIASGAAGELPAEPGLRDFMAHRWPPLPTRLGALLREGEPSARALAQAWLNSYPKRAPDLAQSILKTLLDDPPPAGARAADAWAAACLQVQAHGAASQPDALYLPLLAYWAALGDPSSAGYLLRHLLGQTAPPPQAGQGARPFFYPDAPAIQTRFPVTHAFLHTLGTAPAPADPAIERAQDELRRAASDGLTPPGLDAALAVLVQQRGAIERYPLRDLVALLDPKQPRDERRAQIPATAKARLETALVAQLGQPDKADYSPTDTELNALRTSCPHLDAYLRRRVREQFVFDLGATYAHDSWTAWQKILAYATWPATAHFQHEYDAYLKLPGSSPAGIVESLRRAIASPADYLRRCRQSNADLRHLLSLLWLACGAARLTPPGASDESANAHRFAAACAHSWLSDDRVRSALHERAATQAKSALVVVAGDLLAAALDDLKARLCGAAFSAETDAAMLAGLHALLAAMGETRLFAARVRQETLAMDEAAVAAYEAAHAPSATAEATRGTFARATEAEHIYLPADTAHGPAPVPTSYPTSARATVAAPRAPTSTQVAEEHDRYTTLFMAVEQTSEKVASLMTVPSRSRAARGSTPVVVVALLGLIALLQVAMLLLGWVWFSRINRALDGLTPAAAGAPRDATALPMPSPPPEPTPVVTSLPAAAPAAAAGALSEASANPAPGAQPEQQTAEPTPTAIAAAAGDAAESSEAASPAALTAPAPQAALSNTLAVPATAITATTAALPDIGADLYMGRIVQFTNLPEVERFVVAQPLADAAPTPVPGALLATGVACAVSWTGIRDAELWCYVQCGDVFGGYRVCARIEDAISRPN